MKQAFIIFILCFLQYLKGEASNDYALKIADLQQFQKLAGEPLSLKYGNVKAVKVVLDVANRKLYFLDSKRFVYHVDFCRTKLYDYDDLVYFNDINYRPNKMRRYVLGTVNYYSALNIFTLEFASSEILSNDDVELYNSVKQQFYAPDKLHFFPATGQQIKDFEALKLKDVKTISANQIFKGITYQPIIKKVAYGYLRKVSLDSLSKTILDEHDILITNGSPNELPLTAGVIITEFQPPLSHINILCANRGTPIMAYKKAWTSKIFDRLQDSLVRLEILQDTFYVHKTTLNEAQKSWKNKKHKSVRHLKQNSKKLLLYDVQQLDHTCVSYCGAKASNLGELMRIKLPLEVKFETPPGAFAIPFSFYLQHIKSNGIDSLIKLLNDYDSLPDTKSLSLLLKKVRKAITKAPVDSVLINLVTRKIISNKSGNTYRFRSSTNAEDIDGFNGAGLYDSKTGILNDTSKTIEKAIKKVWASLWNDRAFMERKYFNIDNTSIAMGILVHVAFGTEAVNGVAITKNIYRQEQQGSVINLQKGEVPIVNPPQGIICEQTILIDESVYGQKNLMFDFISYSSLNNNKPLLTESEMSNLKEVLEAIKKHYYYNVSGLNVTNFDNFAMDVEFKYTYDRRLYVKQARFYSK